MVNVMDFDIVVSEFELQSRYFDHFRTNIHGIVSLKYSYYYYCPSPVMDLALNNP